jgi:hypothetical protein
MRSIAWEWKRKDYPLDDDIGDKGAGERELERRNLAMKIIALFDDDPIAQQIVIGMMDHTRGKELERASGLRSTEYESKRTKVRRRIDKFIEKLKT